MFKQKMIYLLIVVLLLTSTNVYASGNAPATLLDFIEQYNVSSMSIEQAKEKAFQSIEKNMSGAPEDRITITKNTFWDRVEGTFGHNSTSYWGQDPDTKMKVCEDFYAEAVAMDPSPLEYERTGYVAACYYFMAKDEKDNAVQGGGNTSGETGNTSGNTGNTSGGDGQIDYLKSFDNAYKDARKIIDKIPKITEAEQAELESKRNSMMSYLTNIFGDDRTDNVEGYNISREDAYDEVVEYAEMAGDYSSIDFSTGIDGVEERNKTIDEIISDAQGFVKPQNLSDTYDQDEFYVGISKIYNILFAIGMVIAVVWGITLGIKFLYASAEGQAEIKKQLLPYITGVFIIFGAFGIWKIVLEIMKIAG